MHWKLNLLAGLCGVALIGAMFFFIPEPAATSNLQFSSLPQKTPPATKHLRPKAHLQVAPAVYNIKEGVLSHRTLYEALTSCEIPPSEVLSLSRSFRPVFDFRCAKPKDIYRVSLNDQNEIQKFVYKTSLTDEYEAIKKKDGSYTVQKREIALDKTVISKVFTINSSLYQAVADFGESQRIAG
ncbi:hypothetical protein [Desulfosarcina cetonica]|uniref:hypothetical protein n=1 Tax=Desulfosarcina cetonica TaxID=90730 RepID=UPI0012EE75D1|nr:hypothetical protein [Desulfosarcina cetonica]